MLGKKGNPSHGLVVSVRESFNGPEIAYYNITAREVPEDDWAFINKNFSVPVACAPDTVYYFVIKSQAVDKQNYYYLANDKYLNNNYDAYREGSIWWKVNGKWASQSIYDYYLKNYFKTNSYHYPRDNNGHRTHCAGIIGAGDTRFDSVGVAFGRNAKIMPLKACDSSGSLWVSSWIAALEYARSMGANIVNMSFSGSRPSPLERSLINSVSSAGLTLVA